MASHNQFLILAIVAILLPTFALATQYIVGDDSGWTNGFDYEAWASNKVFMVGDALVFNYDPTKHNVFKVNATDFKNCTVPPPNEALTTGNDTIILAAPGKKWYICGKADHCSKFNQKLVIDVLSNAPAPAPNVDVLPNAPAPAPNAAYGVMVSGYQIMMAVMVAAAMIIA